MSSFLINEHDMLIHMFRFTLIWGEQYSRDFCVEVLHILHLLLIFGIFSFSFTKIFVVYNNSSDFLIHLLALPNLLTNSNNSLLDSSRFLCTQIYCL